MPWKIEGTEEVKCGGRAAFDAGMVVETRKLSDSRRPVRHMSCMRLKDKRGLAGEREPAGPRLNSFKLDCLCLIMYIKTRESMVSSATRVNLRRAL